MPSFERGKKTAKRKPKPKAPRRLRPGLIGEVRFAFELAITMCGGEYGDIERIAEEQRKLRKLRAEVLRAMRP